MTNNDVSTVALSHTMDYLPPPDPKAVEQAMLIGDLSQMTDEQRISYYVATCRSLNLNPLTRPFLAIKGDDGKMSLYPDKGCAEQLRKLHRVSVKVVGREFLDDLYIVTVRASTPDGREEEAQGAVPMAKAKGTWKEASSGRKYFQADVDAHGREMTIPLTVAERAASVMRCETKAKRRVTLAICGLGMADFDGDPDSAAHPMALTLQTPPAPAEAKPLAEHIEDLYGPSAPAPAGDGALLLYRTQVEDAIRAQPGGDVERWMVWAEKTLLKKDRHLFTIDDYRRLLRSVEAVAYEKTFRKPQESAQEPPEATQAHQDVSRDVPATEELLDHPERPAPRDDESGG